MQIIKKTENSLNFAVWLCYMASLISSLLIVFWILKYSGHGIGFTDEGYYLNWISSPFIYKTSISNFGYIYHPLYILLDGDIPSLRRVNFLLSLSLAFIMSYLFIRSFDHIKIEKKTIFILAIGISVNVLLFQYIPTPSYNHLTLQALMIVSIGVLIINKTSINKNILAYSLISFGGWLAFIAKPTSALGLAIIVLIYLIASHLFRIKFLILSLIIIFLLFFITAIVIDGSVSLFLKRYLVSFEITQLGQSGHGIKDIFRIDHIEIDRNNKSIILVIFLVSLFFLFLNFYDLKIKNFFAIFLSTFILIFIILFTLLEINWVPQYGYHQPLHLFGIFFACIFSRFIFFYKSKFEYLNTNWKIAFFFLIIPYVFALGTNNNYWIQGGIAGIFWLLSGLTFTMPLSIKNNNHLPIICLILISQLITVLHLQERFEKPYGQDSSLKTNKTSISIKGDNNEIYLSKETAYFVNNARNIAKQSGFLKGDNIIDLSGKSPGLVYVLGGSSLGTAWNLGGYIGSNQMAMAKYNTIGCDDIAKSWVLDQESNKQKISNKLLTNLSIDFPQEYQFVGSWIAPKSFGPQKINRIQKLYKPINIKKMTEACRKNNLN